MYFLAKHFSILKNRQWFWGPKNDYYSSIFFREQVLPPAITLMVEKGWNTEVTSSANCVHKSC